MRLRYCSSTRPHIRVVVRAQVSVRGLGNIPVCHAANEYIDIEELVRGQGVRGVNRRMVWSMTDLRFGGLDRSVWDFWRPRYP